MHIAHRDQSREWNVSSKSGCFVDPSKSVSRKRGENLGVHVAAGLLGPGGLFILKGRIEEDSYSRRIDVYITQL